METTIADHEIHANLITGNARADNMEGAEELLETLKRSGGLLWEGILGNGGIAGPFLFRLGFP